VVSGRQLLWIIAWRAGPRWGRGAGPAHVRRLESSYGRCVVGRVVGDAALGFRFVSDASATTCRSSGDAVTFDTRTEPAVGPDRRSTHLLLWLGPADLVGRRGNRGDRMSGSRAGLAARPLTLTGGVQAIVQRPGETQVLSDVFDALETRLAGRSSESTNRQDSAFDRRPQRANTGGGAVLTHRLSEPIDPESRGGVSRYGRAGHSTAMVRD